MNLIEKIGQLKKDRDAFILAHNFQSPEVQEAADYVGGTAEIYLEAVRREERTLLVASVFHMAQVIACLLPEKIVLSPEPEAGCPMVRMIDLDRVEYIRKASGLVVISHIKSSLEALAISDYCCRYSEAVGALKTRDKVLFIPDVHIAKNISNELGKKILYAGGYCPPHVKILPRDIEEMRKVFHGGIVLAHPECRAEVANIADKVLESGDMVRYVGESDMESFIIASEVSLIERLKREFPEKRIVPASSKAVCQSMKRITLEKIYWSLEDMEHRVSVEEEYAGKIRDLLRKLYKGGPHMAF